MSGTDPPSLGINNVTVNEDAGEMVFTVSLSEASVQEVEVDYTTVDGTAVAGEDYTTTSGTLTIRAGETSKTIRVPIVDDAIYEVGPEAFTVELSDPVNATLADDTGVGTILDNESTPMLSVADVSLPEGDSGTTNFDFTVLLSVASALTTTVDYTIADGSARAGADYTMQSDTLTFAPGETSKTVTVVVTSDTSIESDETFFLNLSSPTNASISEAQAIGTILDDDEPVFSIIGDPTAMEGETTTYTVSYTGNPTRDMTVDVETGPGVTAIPDAIEGVDYRSADQTLTFLKDGPRIATINVKTILDRPDGTLEEFAVSLSNPSHGKVHAVADHVTTVIADVYDTRSTLKSAQDLGSLPARRGKGFADNLNGLNERNDYVRFQVRRFSKFTGTLTDLNRNVRLQLLNANGRVLNGSAKPGVQDQTIVRYLHAGTYYLRAFRMRPGATDYRMRLRAVPDCDRFSRSCARDLGTLTTPRQLHGSMGDTLTNTDRDDWFKFRIRERGTVMATLAGLSQNADLQLTDANGTVLVISHQKGAWKEQIKRTLRPGTYYLRVSAASPKLTDYTLSLKMM